MEEEDETERRAAEKLKKISTEIGNYIKTDQNEKPTDTNNDSVKLLYETYNHRHDYIDDDMLKRRPNYEYEKVISANFRIFVVVLVVIIYCFLILGIFLLILIPSLIFKIIYLIAFVIFLMQIFPNDWNKKLRYHKCARMNGEAIPLLA